MDKGTVLGTEPLGTKNGLSLALSAQIRRQEMLSGQEGGKEETPSPIHCDFWVSVFFGKMLENKAVISAVVVVRSLYWEP